MISSSSPGPTGPSSSAPAVAGSPPREAPAASPGGSSSTPSTPDGDPHAVTAVPVSRSLVHLSCACGKWEAMVRGGRTIGEWSRAQHNQHLRDAGVLRP